MNNFFNPKSIAVIGASKTPGKVGYDILKNLIQYEFEGKIYPINPGADNILGKKAYPSVIDVPENIDLAVIVVPPKSVLDVINQCGAKHIDSAIIITAGFRESGIEGLKLETEIVNKAKELGIRFIGPNCLGVIDTHSKMNASFAAGMPAKGSIGFFSQSGALCLAVLDRALPDEIGFSKFISMGNKSDISDIDIMLALADDENTKVILGYIEGISDGKSFMEVAAKVSKKKPVIILKSGVTSSGAKAASSHTGALAGREAAFDAAFKQCGIIRVTTINDLFNYALAFANQPLPKGPDMAIITNSGGPGILAADACDKAGLQLIPLHKELVDELRTFLPPVASFYNPIDILGDSGAERYEKALITVLKDERINGVLVLLTPTATVNVDETSLAIANIAKTIDRPLLTSFMGKKSIEAGAKMLLKNGVPNYNYPEEAVSAISAMYRYHLWINRPEKKYLSYEGLKDKAQGIFNNAKKENRDRLTELEVHDVLNAYGFTMPRSLFARTSEEAVAAAKGIGYPVVMKIISPQIIHKSDIGGVKVNLKNKKEVENAFFEITTKIKNIMPHAHIYGVLIQEMVSAGKEVIMGITKDPQFGHMIMFGLGGIYVEVLKDVSFRIVPLSQEDAYEMIRETKTFPLLRGVRGEAEADIEAIEKSILILSQMAIDFPQIIEADINPLLVRKRGQGVVAIDARFAIGGD
ncbi:MAG: acetate--CoA ligase family protein [Nitrospirae bacterium]|jgi:acetyltransferase|nr:acetate--CoA ligase family protein [Nitrospirota bacterium]